jgi:hypothetical protein
MRVNGHFEAPQCAEGAFAKAAKRDACAATRSR